jgi:hypothetical protein
LTARWRGMTVSRAIRTRRFLAWHSESIGALTLTLSLIVLAGIYIHCTGILPFAWRARDVTSVAPELGYAYTAPLSRTWLETLADRRTHLTEDNRRLGPGQSLHDDVRYIGEGRFSVWGGALYFSASDNTDPRHNGRRYQLFAPRPLPAILIVVALPGVLGGVYLVLRGRGMSPLTSRGFDKEFLLLFGVAATLATLQPWSFLLRNHMSSWDVLRVAVTVLLSVAFCGWRTAHIRSSFTILVRCFVIGFAFICVARWYPDVPAKEVEGLHQWLIGGNRYVAALAAIFAWFRPSFLLYAVASSLWGRGTHEHLTGVFQADVDERPIAEMAFFLILCGMATSLINRLRGQESSAVSTRGYDFAVYAALGVHLSNYLHSGFAKLNLDGPFLAWPFDNLTHALLANSRLLGVVPLDISDSIINQVYVMFAAGVVPANFLTLASELLAIVSVSSAFLLPLTLAFYDMWHLAVFLTTGIFFWKWILVNAGFMIALLARNSRPSPAVRLMAAVTMVCAPYFFSIFAAGWYDSPSFNRLAIRALTHDGRAVSVPPAFFLNYSFAVSSNSIWSPDIYTALHPTATYGTTMSHRVLKDSFKCGDFVKGFTNNTRVVRQEFVALMQALHAQALKNADAQGRARFIYLYPHHIVTNPLRFSEFAALDLRTVQAYRVRIDAVCTNQSDLLLGNVVHAGGETVIAIK